MPLPLSPVRRTDALIVGGGPAGAAAAITLARAGRMPLLLERRREPAGTVCGGFVGWDALEALRHLGIDVAALGAHPIGKVRIVAGRRSVVARLPHRAAGLSRRTLDAALLRAAREAGAEVEQGVAVREIVGDRARLADGRELTGAPLIVATGKHAIRGVPREGAWRGAVGLRTTIPAPANLHGAIELHLFRGGYAGLLRQEDGRANLCLSVSAARLAEAGGTADALIGAVAHEAPKLAERAQAVDEPWVSIAGVPYGWRATQPGPWRVGDQAAVIASVVGDGIAIARASGRAAGEALLTGDSADGYQRRFARRARRPLAIAEAARRLAERPASLGVLFPLLRHMPVALTLAARLTRIGT